MSNCGVPVINACCFHVCLPCSLTLAANEDCRGSGINLAPLSCVLVVIGILGFTPVMPMSTGVGCAF